jgi:hypothetical protein
MIRLAPDGPLPPHQRDAVHGDEKTTIDIYPAADTVEPGRVTAQRRDDLEGPDQADDGCYREAALP